MRALLIECLIRSSLIAAFAGLALSVMRIKAAGARHAVWLGVMLAMLALPTLIAWGPKARLPAPQPAASRPAALRILPANNRIVPQVEPARSSIEPLSRSQGWDWAIVFYLVGASAFVIRLAVGLARVRALIRGKISCAAPVTVGWLRPKVILPADSSEWPQEKLDAVLAHEHEHARRRDPLWRLIALLNRALFWFHPLAWWLDRKLSGLAEEACDAAVLARGYDPRDYSEFLLDLARSVRRAGSRDGALGVAMPGIGLEYRIRRMLSGSAAPRVSRARIAVTAALCAIAAAIFAAGTLVDAPSGARGRPEFEVASVRPSNPSAGGGFKTEEGKGSGSPPPSISHGRFTYSDSLFGMVVRAYAIKGCRPAFEASCALLSGGPDWVKKDRFDIQAKIPEGAPEYTFLQFFNGQAPQIQLMLQALLAERFNLKMHREKRQMPVYALTIAKKGPKLKKSGAVDTVRLPDGTSMESRGVRLQPAVLPDGESIVRVNANNASIGEVVDIFSSILERPVLDRTGLKGEFDFKMEYAADGDRPLTGLGGPEVFTAFQQQAGLKLEATRAAVDVLVIDRAAKPSEN